MNQIKGTPADWKEFQGEVLTMVKQLECSTFFLLYLVLILNGINL